MAAKTKILYVTPVWSGFQAFVFEGKNEFLGMPAFNNVFRSLLKRDDVVISLVLVVTQKDRLKAINVPTEFADSLDITRIDIPSGVQSFLAYLKAVFSVSRIIKSIQPNVVFGHGSVGAIGGLAAKINNIKYVQRIYGTFLINEINDSKWQLFKRHPLEYLSFSLRKNATIITNDGTHGDRVFNKLNTNPKELRFWVNGFNPDVIKVKPFESSEPYIVYVARVDHWKRQHLLVEAVGLLKRKGIKVNVKIVGQIISKEYESQILDLIQLYDLKNQIELLGGVSAEKAISLIKGAELSCSLYHTSNLGNVLIESLYVATPVLAINCNESLDVIPEDCYLNTTENAESVADKISFALENKTEMQKMAERAHAFVEQELSTWEQRVEKEINELID